MADSEDNADDSSSGAEDSQGQESNDENSNDENSNDGDSQDAESQEAQGQDGDDGEEQDSSGEEGDQADLKYEKFDVPKGFKLEGDRLDSFKEFSKDLGFNQEEAQKVVDYFVKMQTGEMQALEDRLAQRAKDDISAVYGWKSLQAGDGIEANVGLANTGIARLQEVINNIFGDDAISLFQHLKDRGLDTDPGITQMAYAHATTVSEDTLVKERGNPVVKKDRQDVMYPPTDSG